MPYSASTWVDNEFDRINLGDQRLNQRFKVIAAQLAKHCGKTLASSFYEWKMIKASYRFFANPKVNEMGILTPHIEQTVKRITDHENVLLLQDSTYLDYNNRPKTQGLDLTFRSKFSTASEGLILHNTLAVTDQGTPLGLVDQRFSERNSFVGKNAHQARQIRHWNRPIDQKESARWIHVVKKCHQIEFGQAHIVHVADRECDLYEFYRDAGDLGEDVLVRASRNRSINKRYRRSSPTCLLFDHLKSKKAQGKVTITIKTNAKKKFMQAELSIVYCPITMPPPPNKTIKKDGPRLPMVPLFAIMAIERRPPRNTNGIFWVLLTNLDVNTLAQAIEKIHWYSLRWNIELFHKILKSGCGVKAAQLRHADRLKKYIVLKSIIAWRLFWLAKVHEHDKESSCSTMLSEIEWSILYRKTKRTKTVPDNPPTVGEAFVWIAKLGGYIGRA